MKKIKFLIPTLAMTTISGCTLPLACCNNSPYEMSELTKDIVDELIGNEEKQILGICSIPHPSKHCQGIADYLTNRIGDIYRELGGAAPTVHFDCYSNVYCDIPANNPSGKNYDWIILQGHIDMVVAGLTEEESLTKPIYPEIEGKLLHSKDHKTSLGADNGIGVAMILEVMKKSKEFEHGPIRCIFTADEEIGLIGAHYIDKISPEIMYIPEANQAEKKFIPYLLNIDAEQEGDIYRSCTGNFLDRYYRTFEDTDEEPLTNAYDIKLDGLKGGHSGLDIVYGRANADRILFEFMNFLVDKNVPTQLVAYDHIKKVDGQDVDIKWETNQLIQNGHIQFFSNASREDIIDLWNEYLATLPERYPGENINTWTTNISTFTRIHDQSFVCKEATTNLAKLIGSEHENADTPTPPSIKKGMPYGVFKWANKETLTPAASGNIGPISLRTGIKPNTMDFEMRNLVRTSIYGVGEQPNNQDPPEWSVGWMEPKYTSLAGNAGVLTQHESGYQPWQFKDDVGNKLVDFLKQTYTNLGVRYKLVDTKGGVEPAEWITKNPDLICSCIGAQIDNAHTTDETLHLDTIDNVYKAIIEVLKWMGKTK